MKTWGAYPQGTTKPASRRYNCGGVRDDYDVEHSTWALLRDKTHNHFSTGQKPSCSIFDAWLSNGSVPDKLWSVNMNELFDLLVVIFS